MLSRNKTKPDMTSILSKATDAVRAALMPYQFGFISGHSYLGERELRSIHAVMAAQAAAKRREILADYERKFARLVGDGSAVTFASARMAFYALMKALGIGSGDEVVLPAFTCAVMPNAVMRTGARPVYSDIDGNTCGSDAHAIDSVVTARTKLIVAQHSFGIPCDIRAIADAARRRGIFLVEDCSIALDSSLDGISVGNWGDAALFSTDHSKPLNTILGGLLYTRNAETLGKVSAFARNLPALSIDHQRRLYQQLELEKQIGDPRRYARILLGTRMRLGFRRLGGSRRATFLTSDLDAPHTGGSGHPYPYPAAMPPFLAKLGLYELERWPEEKLKRKRALTLLLDALERSPTRVRVPAAYKDAARNITPLRLVFTSPDRNGFLSKLGNIIDASGIWFQQPVIGATRELQTLGYSVGSCPEAERICAEILNLPCALDAEWSRSLAQSLLDAGLRGAKARD